MGNSGGETPVDWLPPLDTFSALRLVVAAAGGLATAFVGGMLGFGGGRPRLLVVYWAVENPVDAAGTNLGASSSLGKATLNLPSVEVPRLRSYMTGSYTFTGVSLVVALTGVYLW